VSLAFAALWAVLAVAYSAWLWHVCRSADAPLWERAGLLLCAMALFAMSAWELAGAAP